MLSMIKVDFRKAILSMSFFISVLGVTSIYFLVAKSEMNQSIDILYIFRMSIEWIGTYHLMIILMCTIPFSASFYREWSSKSINYNIIRTNVKFYSWSKFIVCLSSGGLSIVLGTILFMLIMSNYIPFLNVIEQGMYEYTMANELIYRGDVWQYISIYILLRFLYGAFWASVGLLISTYIPNIFVAFSSPFILSYVYRIIAYKLPVYFRLEHIANGSMGNFINNSFMDTLSYSIIVFAVSTMIVGILFVHKVKWRIENE